LDASAALFESLFSRSMTFSASMKIANRKQRLLPVLLTGLLASLTLLVGCDEGLTPDLDNPPGGDEGTPFVQFDQIDTTTATLVNTADLQVEAPIATGSNITVEFETSGAAEPGTDFSIPDTTYENEFEPIRDTLDVEPPIDSVESVTPVREYTVEYDESSGTGTVFIDYIEAGQNLDYGTIFVERISNPQAAQTRPLGVELTGASLENGDPISVGRGEERGFASTKTTLVGQAGIVTGSGNLNYGAVSVGSDSTKSVSVFNLLSTPAGDFVPAGLPSQLSNFQIVGADASAFSIVQPTETTTIQPGGAVPVVVTFSPENAGVKEASLVFDTTNDFDTPRVTIPLLGSGASN
jgi:hypothetical protein